MRLRSNFLQNIWHLDILPYLIPLVPTNKASATFDKCNFFLCAAVPLQNYRGTTHICSSGQSEPREQEPPPPPHKNVDLAIKANL